MGTAQIRKLLHEYIRFAEEKKVKALYTIVSEEIREKRDHWTKEFERELKRRSAQSGSIDLIPRSKASRRIKDLLKAGS